MSGLLTCFAKGVWGPMHPGKDGHFLVSKGVWGPIRTRVHTYHEPLAPADAEEDMQRS